MKFEAVLILLITCVVSYSTAISHKQTNATFPCAAGQLCSKVSNQNVKDILDPCTSNEQCNKQPGDMYQCINGQCLCPSPYIFVYSWEVNENVCVTGEYYIGDSCRYDAQCNYWDYYRECDSGECECVNDYTYRDYYCMDYWVTWKKWCVAVGCVLAVAAIAGIVGFFIYRCKEKKAREKRERMLASQPQVLYVAP